MPRNQLPAQLRLPLIAAPMFLASNPELVSAACRAGVVGCLPTHNAPRDGGLRNWLERLTHDAAAARQAGGSPAPFAVNIVVARNKPAETLADELAACREFGVRLVTTTSGDPSEVVKQAHDWGALVVHDASSVLQAEQAAAAGVDGLTLICAGAGGSGGTLTPLAFVPRVRRFFDGLVVLAGGASTGRGIAVAQLLGADLAAMGTRFIATQESGVAPGYKQMLADADMADVVCTNAIIGANVNFLRASLAANGLDPDNLPPLDANGRPTISPEIKPWTMVWSGGHGVGMIDNVPSVADLVDELEADYRAAVDSFAAKLARRAPQPA